MTSELIQDRGRGPEIAGTRITVYNLLPSFLDPSVTETEICRIYALTVEQVASARAYVLGHADTVLAQRPVPGGRVAREQAVHVGRDLVQRSKRQRPAGGIHRGTSSASVGGPKPVLATGPLSDFLQQVPGKVIAVLRL
jgi:uncharacterized protein (DUF433 family)